MMKLCITDHVFRDLDITHQVLDDLGVEIVDLHCSHAAQLTELAQDTDALMTCYLPGINAEVMAHMPKLKGIVRTGIGVDTIDLDAAKRRGIQVANVPDYCLDEVSDHAVALILTLNRKIALSSGRIKRGDYGLGYVRPIKALRNNTVAVLGYGRIGKRIAAKLSAFGCHLLFYDPFVEADNRAQKVDLDTALEESDIIVLQMPSTSQTRHMLDRTAFAKMKKTPIIVNAARGDLIDTKALEDALETGIVSGAGLDVIEDIEELKADSFLCKCENVILTPHSAWVSDDAMAELQRLSAMEIRKILKGEPVRNSVIR